MNLYKEELTDHYRNPRNRGPLWGENRGPLHEGQNRGVLLGANFASEQHNPSCGDSVSWQGSIEAGQVKAIAFEGKGCVISQGTASMLSEAVKGLSPDAIIGLDTPFMLALIGLELGPTRLRCALLPLEALQQGIVSYQKSINIPDQRSSNA